MRHLSSGLNAPRPCGDGFRAFAGSVLSGVLALTACGGRAAPVLPEPIEVIEFEIPWEDAFPSDVAVDAEGRVWFTDRLISVIGRFDPETREFVSYPTPTPKSAPYGLVRTADGALWYGASRAGKLGRVDPATGVIEEFTIAATGGGPHLLALAGDVIWFTMREDLQYGRYDTHTGDGALYPAPRFEDLVAAESAAEVRIRGRDWKPYGIAVGGDGTVWVGEYAGGGLLRFDPRTGGASLEDLREQVGERTWPASMPDSIRRRMERVSWRRPVLRRIATDARGRLWLTDFSGGRVDRYDPETGDRESYPSLARRAQPYGIAVDASGRVWYNESGNDAIVVLDPATGERRSFTIRTPRSTVRHITFDEERGRVWLPLSDTGRLGLIELR